MEFIILFAISFILTVNGGVITHHEELSNDGGLHHERATSYQNIQMEHFYAVPTFIKKEHKHLLEHPISIGKSSSKVEIHHGGKHDHGYAIATIENDLNGHHNHDDGLNLGGQEAYHQGQQVFQGHGLGAGAGYQVHDQGVDYSQYQGHQQHQALEVSPGAYEGEANLGHYQIAADSGYQQVEDAGTDYDGTHHER